ncbi:MAG: hypothetical protein ACC657_10135 [Thiohalomonadales bacterium]
MNVKFNFTLLCLSSFLVQNIYAVEIERNVMPRITVGGQVIATADGYDYKKSAPDNKEGNINTDNSALLLQFDKNLYGAESGVAGASIGFEEISGEIIFNEFNAFYWNKSITFRIGKTKLRNTIIKFPTLREKDLVDYSYVNTASSDADLDQRYGSNIELDWYFDHANHSLGIWTGTRNNDANNATAPDGFDTRGFRYNYNPSVNLRYLNRVRHAAILLDSQRVETTIGDDWMQSVIAGIEFNLNINPTSSWSMGLQAISSEGVNGAIDLSSVSSRAKANSSAQVLSLQYTRRPHLITRWQVALILASKKYDDITNAKNTSMIANFSYVLGQGFNLIAQINKTDYSNDINNGNDETIYQAGISFQFDAVFNNTIGERNSILNTEHGYIP